MSDKKISQLNLASTLAPSAIIPVTQTDQGGQLATFGVTASTLWAGASGTGVGSYYSFPNDPTTPVLPADIGKIAMNDGSGTAKLYALSAATGAVAGSWTIQLDSSIQASLNSNSSVTITQLTNTTTTIYRSSWLTAPLPTIPAELAMIKAALDALGLNINVTNNGVDTVTITESGYQGYAVTANLPANSFSVVHLSTPASPVSASAFPLGKILDVQGTGSNSTVLISANMIETYTLTSATTIDPNVFNTSNYGSYDFRDPTTFDAITHLIAIPDAGGTVTTFDASRYTFDFSFLYTLRDQFLGIILNVSGTTVTVLNLNGISPIFNLVLKDIWYNEYHK